MNHFSTFKGTVWPVFFTLLFLLPVSCKKEEQAPEIPYVYVHFSLNPNGTMYQELNAVNGSVTVTGGYNGILIFRVSFNEFMAFERACPYEPLTKGAQVRVEQQGLSYCFCPVCGSKYIMTYGTPFEGPSPYPLKQYRTFYDGAMLYVTN